MPVSRRLRYSVPYQTPGDVPLVLIIDDDPDQRALACMAISRAGGLRVMTAQSGSEAQCALQSRKAAGLPPPDLVITDLKMPVMNGLEVMHVFRERDDMRQTPVVFLTSAGHPRDLLAVKAAGADGVFQKPMHFDELVALMRSLASLPPHVVTEASVPSAQG